MSRRVELPFEPAVATAAAAWSIGPRVDLRDGSLRLDLLPTSSRCQSPAAVAIGRLESSAATIFRFTSVVVELDVWSRSSSELTVRPARRQGQTWGERRRRRYFALAHEAADHLCARLLRPHAGEQQPAAAPAVPAPSAATLAGQPVRALSPLRAE